MMNVAYHLEAQGKQNPASGGIVKGMPRTLYDKIFEDHTVDVSEDGTALLYVDRHLVHEVTSPQAFEGLRTAGRPVRRTDCTCVCHMVARTRHRVPARVPCSLCTSGWPHTHTRTTCAVEGRTMTMRRILCQSLNCVLSRTRRPPFP